MTEIARYLPGPYITKTVKTKHSSSHPALFQEPGVSSHKTMELHYEEIDVSPAPEFIIIRRGQADTV